MLLGGPRLVVSTVAFHARVRGSVPGLGGLKEIKNVSSPSTCETQYSVGSLCDREVACSASDRQGTNFESCLAQFSLYVHKGGLKPDSFHFASVFQKVKKHNDFWRPSLIFLDQNSNLSPKCC